MSVDLTCHSCGYDLRAQPHDGKCPECGTFVEESRQMAAIPRRPAWRDSDPRWRRRMLAGTWLLVLIPLIEVLNVLDLAASVPVPKLYDFWHTTLADALICWRGVYQPLIFCMGAVLLFSRERGRRRNRLDWTRRWGVGCSYVVLLISAAEVLLIGALVLVGIAALFIGMPAKYQPALTPLFADIGAAYLRYGPQPMIAANLVLVAFSSITILLACAPLFYALRSAGSKRLAAGLLAPLGLFALLHLGQTAKYCLEFYLGFSKNLSIDVGHFGTYFFPELVIRRIANTPLAIDASGWTLSAFFFMEAAKWCIVLAIAIWLSIAQCRAAMRKAPGALDPLPAS